MRGKLSVPSIVDLVFRGGFNPLRAERSWLLAGATLCGTVALFWAGGPAYAQVCAHGLCEEGAMNLADDIFLAAKASTHQRGNDPHLFGLYA